MDGEKSHGFLPLGLCAAACALAADHSDAHGFNDSSARGGLRH
jgi:hypothetical protein